ncbi:cytochrome P450 4C1-like isoform X1 [Zophobas morio]|uniref:cytochrome P450 4C1-like isoform X1 n=2 Tax=Zophobas morio TaxID=2755281 RepID=UPI003082DA6E
MSVWKRHRKMINPIFNRKNLDHFVEVFAKQSTALGEYLEKYVGMHDVNLFQIVKRCNLDITCETMLGVQTNAQEGESEVAKWIDKFSEIMLYRLYKFWYHYDFIFKWTTLYNEGEEFINKYNLFIKDIIKNKDKSVTSESPTLLDFLLDLFANRSELTTDEIVDEIKTFVLAGFDTTTVMSCFVITMLAMHPDIQKRVYDEVLTVLGPERMSDFRDLPCLKYTDLVIKETLRLFPVLPFIAREVLEDLCLDEVITLPKGSLLLLGVIQVHRSAEYWSDPLKFDLDRFLPETATNRHPFTYIPFSAGPMNCIGQKYGKMAFKTIVAILVRKFQFRTEYKTVDEIKLTNKVIVRPRDGFKCSFEMRKKE